MIYVNSETILNNDRFFSPYMRKVIHSKGEKHLTITYNVLIIYKMNVLHDTLPNINLDWKL